MKIMLLSAALFLAAGATIGGFHEASALRHFHARYGLPLPLQDWMYDAINVAIFGAIGFVAGVVFGAVLDWLLRHRRSQSIL